MQRLITAKSNYFVGTSPAPAATSDSSFERKASDMQRSKIVVFGGAGFIGGHLLRALSARQEADLVSVDLRKPKMRVSGVDYRIGDVRDLSGFDVEGEIDRIYNLAAVHTTPGHPTHEYYETNIAGATQITAFARRRGVTKIIFTSSISVYGPSEEPKLETANAAPESSYGWSKWLAEGIQRSWLEESQERRLVIVRPAVIFGAGEDGNFVRLAKLLRKGLFVYPGRTDTIKACFYVEDLIESILFAELLKERYILFNGSYPDRYTISQIVETMRQVELGSASTFVFPKFLLMAMAHLLSPLSAAGLGIHPDRITKLVRSTDVVPGWLSEHGRAPTERLTSAIERWKAETNGRFD